MAALPECFAFICVEGDVQVNAGHSHHLHPGQLRAALDLQLDNLGRRLTPTHQTILSISFWTCALNSFSH